MRGFGPLPYYVGGRVRHLSFLYRNQSLPVCLTEFYRIYPLLFPYFWCV
nr:MAG TPA: hypothetical protein [Caudoviricetes sp.]DAL34420.1 MAG TPA_asm: hypothetical protein [Bacteriophage sp.]